MLHLILSMGPEDIRNSPFLRPPSYVRLSLDPLASLMMCSQEETDISAGGGGRRRKSWNPGLGSAVAPEARKWGVNFPLQFDWSSLSSYTLFMPTIVIKKNEWGPPAAFYDTFSISIEMDFSLALLTTVKNQFHYSSSLHCPQNRDFPGFHWCSGW